MNKKFILGVGLTGCLFFIAVIARADMHHMDPAQAAEMQGTKKEKTGRTAKALIKGTAPDSTIIGRIDFTEKNDGVKVVAHFFNVPPGNHGFHVHENGSCAEEGKAAGSHFNPDEVRHGDLHKDGFAKAHAGDLGNITIDADGSGYYFQVLKRLSLSEGKYNITGKAVILHEKADDFGQPTGNAGGRIGCGIIEIIQ